MRVHYFHLVLWILDYAKENMSVFDYDENSINETETRNIEVICTITVNNTPTKLKCTITGSDDNSIESMSIITMMI